MFLFQVFVSQVTMRNIFYLKHLCTEIGRWKICLKHKLRKKLTIGKSNQTTEGSF